MNAMILAAGHGTRLGELGRTVPKVLVDVGGEPLLARQIRYLKDSGIARIVINAHHLAEQVESFVAEHPLAADIDVVVEPHLLGTAGGVRNALPHLGEQTFVVLYGDVITDEPVSLVSETHQETKGVATVTVYRTGEVDGKGTVEITPDGTVSTFHEKADTHVDGHAYVNAGLYIVEPSLLWDLPISVALDFGHDVFPAALAQRQTIAAHILATPVMDMGTPSMLQAARSKLGEHL
jgi:NDP-sugar pyrophosphorylase family protein